MGFWSAARKVWLALALGATIGCNSYEKPWCLTGNEDCTPTAEAAQKLCPTDTHTCVPYIGGGWDNVVRWQGAKEHAPNTCPQGASHISFWGQTVATPKPGTVSLPLYVVGCGFTEPGTCEGEIDNGASDVCAPAVNDWPACIVANSPRECPDPYKLQTLVGSDAPGDTSWTVCCTGAGPDPRSHGL